MKRNYPFSIVDEPNDELSRYGKRIRIEEHQDEPGIFQVDIIDVSEDGQTLKVTEYADNYYEHELQECVNDAKLYAIEKARSDAEKKALREHLITFRILNGWTHDMPALVYSLTSVDLYFHDFDTDGIQKVTTDSIDFYADRNGEFLIHEDDYEIAEQQIYEHDELGYER